jgi:hypothetical protein
MRQDHVVARSRWRDEDVWGERLQSDQDAIRARVGQACMISLGTFLTQIDADGLADFFLVYGKAAREGIEATPDVDFYFEASWIHDPNDPDRHIQVEGEYNGVRFHAYGWPRGALLTNLRAGEGFSFGVVRDALIFVDRGPFREALALIDDEGLELAPGESMDK